MTSPGSATNSPRLDIARWDGPAAQTLDDTYRQIEQLGAATGTMARPPSSLLEMQPDRRARRRGAGLDEPLTSTTSSTRRFYSADSTTFIGELYALLGLRNIADRAEGDTSASRSSTPSSSCRPIRT